MSEPSKELSIIAASQLKLVASRAIVAIACLIDVTGCHPTTSHPTTTPTAPSTTTAPATTIRFVDVAQQAGLNYQWALPAKRPANILGTIGNGCAFLDYNGDGYLDILLVGPKPALFKGDGHEHFTDVTHQVGLDKLHGDFRGCAVGDYDNDGYPDIYLSAYRGGALLHNDHGTHFTDVTAQAGIAPQPWGSSAAFVDVDNDGKLDLYVGNYVDFGPNTNPQLCNDGGLMTTCGPRYYKAIHGVLYHNTGCGNEVAAGHDCPSGGKFEDVTKLWGADQTSGKVLGVATADFNDSGHQSIELANDQVAGNLLMNGGGRFTDVGASSGVAFNTEGSVVSGMGVDWGDYDNDGRLDLVVATFQRETKCIYHNDGHNLFTERSAALGISAPTTPNVAFGAKWLDADNDGYLDLMITNGHVEDNVDQIDKSTTFKQPIQFFHNERGEQFTDASAALTGDAGQPILGRGLAVGDFDNDGHIDALVVDSDGKPLLLHNETPSTGHWLLINLIGDKSNRGAEGALLTMTAGNVKLLRECTTSGSFFSASDRRVHFGLGPATQADTITVHWPSGHVDTYHNIKADQIVTLREGIATPK